MWDIGTPESNPVCEFVRRIRGLGRIAIRKEHVDWIFDDLLYNHKNTQYRLEKGQLPETQGYIKSRPIESFLSRYIATTGDQREKTYDLRKDLEVSVIYMVFQLNKVANTEGIEKKGIDYWDKFVTKKFGSTAMKILTVDHPEITEDPVLRWAIDTAMLQTRTEIDDAVKARREFGCTYEDASVQRIYDRVRGKVALVASAMIETMIDMHFNFGEYGGLPNRERDERGALQAARKELFDDYVRNRYPTPSQVDTAEISPIKKFSFWHY